MTVFGYRKPIFRLFIIEIRSPRGGSYCEFVHETNRSVAIAKAMREFPANFKFVSCRTEAEMNDHELDQARDWLKMPKLKSSMPSRCEPYLDQG